MNKHNMSFHMSPLLTFLLLAAFGGLPPNLATNDGPSTMLPNTGSAVIAYWQTMLPLSTMPSAVRDILSPNAEANGIKLNHPPLFNPTVDIGKEANGVKLNDPAPLLNPTVDIGKEANGVNLNDPAPLFNPTVDIGKEANRVNLNDPPLLNPTVDIGKEANAVKLNNPAPLFNPTVDIGKEANRVNLNDPPLLNPTVDIGKEANNGDIVNPSMHISKDSDGHEHGHFHGGHDHMNLRNMVFFVVDALTPGSMISPYIHPVSSPGAPLLPRDVADSIPMSTKSFTEILRKFAPLSRAMVERIWSSLELCEHPHPTKGEQKECVTSIESMIDLAASTLKTGDLRALSSPRVPVEGCTTASKVYTVVAVRAMTSPGNTMTCHGIPFPYKVFVCHALPGPTKVYSVMLESDGMDEEEEKIEALVVCHLDTAEFDPMKMPPHVKPGDAPVCHFLTKDDILWAPAATTLGTQAADEVTTTAQ